MTSPTFRTTTFRAVTPYPFVFRTPAPPPAPPVASADLRPMIEQLGFAVRDQNPRPTCSVFAITFALEFMYATRHGVSARDLSEEYLNHVANLVSGSTADGDFYSNIDAGYQKWGIVTEARVPYQKDPITAMDQGILDEGARVARFVADFVKPWDASVGATTTQVDRVTAYLDQMVPVCFGGWWPTEAAATTTEINGVEVMDTLPVSSKQSGEMTDGHSVALVGYTRDAAFPGGGYFVYRNSWGATWGDDGYGYMPFEYVTTYANDLLAYRTKPITAKPGTRVGAVATATSLDVLVTDSAGEVHAAAWDAGLLNARWRGWWSVRGGMGGAGTPVSVVSRGAGKLDAFVAGTDGRTWTAAQLSGQGLDQWNGWWNVLDGKVPVGGTVSAVSRAADHLDVFLTSTDGGVYTAAWRPGAPWGGWWRIGTLVAKPGTPVAAVSRGPATIDIVVAGSDGKTYTARWDAAQNGGKWQPWVNVNGGGVPAGGAVSVVARTPDHLDVFLTSTDGGVYTAAWKTGGQWQGWWRIGTLAAKPGSLVSAVSRGAGLLDIFVVGADGKTYTAAWDATKNSGQWQAWANVLTGAVPAGGAVTAVSRDASTMDLFLVSNDSRVYTAGWKSGTGWRGWWRVE